MNQLKLTLDQAHQEEEACLKRLVAAKLQIKEEDIQEISLVKKALDARKREQLHFSYGVDVSTKLPEEQVLQKLKDPQISLSKPKEYLPLPATKALKLPPVIIGAGPGGLLAALILAEAGLCPILLEQGEDIDTRQKTVAAFWQNGQLNPISNVQFGEGGAGTFSDGKLTTNTKDLRSFKVLSEFVEAGAPQEILYLAKPHIGTDLLQGVVKNLRNKIIRLGGEVRFGHRLTNIYLEEAHSGAKAKQVTGVEITTPQMVYSLATNQVILAIGHSARPTFQLLYDLGVPMLPKPFSVGVRIEHLQQDINESQYGKFAPHPALASADYKLACHLPNGRSVYTFCMCPGGSVVAAASQSGAIVTNGMSLHHRGGTNSNSALLVGVEPKDFGSDHPLAGIAFQASMEEAAFQLAGNSYSAPCQLVGDFLKGQPSQSWGKVKPSYLPGVSLGQINPCFPDFVNESLALGLQEFAKKLKAFGDPEGVLTAPETRSSSPVKIPRSQDCQCLDGLYPCGEGSGHAGGIISAAVDGIRCAEALLK